MPQQTSATREPGGDATRPVVGDLAAGGLFQAGRREVHEIGVGAELLPRPPPEPGLGERRGGQAGVVDLPEPGHRRHRVVADGLGRGRQGLLAAGCQQLPECVKVHVV